MVKENPLLDDPRWGNFKFRTLEAHDVEHLPEAPGLYLFAAADLLDGDWLPLYVGQTGDLRERIGRGEGTGLPTHENWQEAVGHTAPALPYIHYRVVRSEEKRDELECRIWRDHQPPVNKKAPDGCKRYEKRLANEARKRRRERVRRML